MQFSGDFRTDENIALAGHQTLWVREHNRLVDILKKNKPNWKPEKMFQEVRRINIAQYQHIIYNEFLPLLIGWYISNIKLWHSNSMFGSSHSARSRILERKAKGLDF